MQPIRLAYFRMVAVPMETEDAPVENGSGKTVANPSVLPLFGQLSNLNPAKRVEAAANLVKILKDSTEADLDYTVTRLVKGLAANKGWSRPGFTVGLISVLKNCEINFQTVIDKMNEVSSNSSRHKSFRPKTNQKQFGPNYLVMRNC